jgi:hypothetical protein
VTPPDPLAVECPTCDMWPGRKCSPKEVYDKLIGMRRHSMAPLPHAARVRAAEKKEKEENRG